MSKKLGMVTIGQAPRDDLVEDFLVNLPSDVEVVQVGALDDLDLETITSQLSPRADEILYVTRLRDGSEVRVSKNKLIPLMRSKISYLNSIGVDIIAILCSGEFPRFEAKSPIIYPDKVLKGIASSISYVGKVAVLIPNEKQVSYAYSKWNKYFIELEVISISPYSSSTQDFIDVAKFINENKIGLIIMDCMGYKFSHRDILKNIARNSRIIITRGVLARILTEIM